MSSQYLGPFLMHPSPTSMGFWFFSKNPISNAVIIVGDQTINLKLNTFPNYFIYTCDISGLNPKTTYYYSLRIDDENYLPRGLEQTDLTFTTFPDDNDYPMDFILMSCHGVEEYERKHSLENTWTMWKKINSELDANKNCYFAVLGGDQVYMDDAFQTKIETFKEGSTLAHREEIIRVYIKYWENPEYHKVFCRLPSFLMWDDHDLIDGFGSRSDSFKKLELKESWSNYKKAQSEAFLAFQAVRNPNPLIKDNTNYSFIFEHLNFSLLSLDARSERNVNRNQMLSSKSWDKITTSITNSQSSDFVFINSPVTMARMGGDLEKHLGSFANYLWMTTNLFQNVNNGLKGLFWQLIAFLTFFTYQYELPNFPYISSNFVIVLLCIILLFRSYLGSSLFSGKLRTTLRTATWAVLLLATFFIFWEIHQNRKHLQSVTQDALLIELISNSKLYAFILCSAIITHLFFGIKKAKKISITLPFIHVVLFVFCIMWSGIPGKNFNLNILTVIFSPILSITLSVIGLAQYYGAIDEIASLDDDIKDGWSSEQNKTEFKRLIKIIKELIEKDKKVVILSGDIHTGGLTEFKFHDLDKTFYQITSSPITYPPMPPLVEKLTSGIKPIALQENLIANNIFFVSQRNFAVVSIHHKNIKVRFIFEEQFNGTKTELHI